ncbi:GNAT family N-acetyltransferase [Granulicella arctica]|uniref:GNAT family N-acetyltransferase n=1 Tax=Granulicella arctica TaxID=940613 RepID=UPI0021DF77CE|nr:GNAT family N-acetyltransferase [Granulicella arctica]
MFTRPAQLQDASQIYQLVGSLCHDGTLLPRSYNEICCNIETFTVVEADDHSFAGCAALHVYGQHLAEVRSIVVRPEIKGHGAGGLLVGAVLAQASAREIRCVCLFTRIPEFFAHYRFHIAEHAALRDKVLKDCLQCPRRNACDETAMAIGDLPAASSMEALPVWLTAPQEKLVQLHV